MVYESVVAFSLSHPFDLIRYEDKRLPAPWDDVKPWKAEKPLTPWGTVPVLDYDGVVIGQSTSANRSAKTMIKTLTNNMLKTMTLTNTMIKNIDQAHDKDHEHLNDRFLAKEFGFAGKDNAEQAEADEMVDVIVDLIDEQVSAFFDISNILIAAAQFSCDNALLVKAH